MGPPHRFFRAGLRGDFPRSPFYRLAAGSAARKRIFPPPHLFLVFVAVKGKFRSVFGPYALKKQKKLDAGIKTRYHTHCNDFVTFRSY